MKPTQEQKDAAHKEFCDALDAWVNLSVRLDDACAITKSLSAEFAEADKRLDAARAKCQQLDAFPKAG